MRLTTLRSQLIIAVTLVVATVVVVQICIRAFVILPQLKELSLEYVRFELRRTASEVNQEFRALENLVYDNAVWDETFSSISKKDTTWFEKTFFIPASYSTLGITGWYFFDSNAQFVAGQHRNRSVINRTIVEQIVASGALSLPNNSDELVKTTFAVIGGSPTALIASPVLPSDEQGESNGIALILQEINKAFIDRITPDIDDDILFHTLSSLSENETKQAVRYSELNTLLSSDFKPQSQLERLYILFANSQDDALFALSIKRPKTPDKGFIFDISLLAGMLFSVFSLLIFYVFINRKLIAPVYRLLDFVKCAQDQRDFTQRCNLDGNNEMAQLGGQLNQLFSTIEEHQNVLAEQNRVLQSLSTTDALTGLSNRRHFDEWMENLARDEKAKNTSISMLMIDIDHFKLFNDQYGHAKGDEALRKVAQCIKESLHQATDHPFRFGGEEFAVVLLNTTLEEAEKVAENIRAYVESKDCEHAASPTSSVVTVSIGASCSPTGVSLDNRELFKKADSALYAAKEEGRNRVFSKN